MKKIIALCLSLILIVTTASASWCSPYENKLLKDETILYTSKDVNSFISKGEFLALVCRSKGIKSANENYILGYREAAIQNGFCKSFPADLNILAGTISRYEAGDILYSAYKESLEAQNSIWMEEVLLDYANVPSEYKETLSQICLNGIVSGKVDGMYHGWDALTIGEALTLICRCKYSEYRVIPASNEFKYLISEYTTKTTKDSNRNFNVAKSANSVNGTVIKPGEQFSYNTCVGHADKEHGYKLSTVISGGKYVKGYGGGVCQSTTTLYNAVLRANLQIDERYAHGLKSSYVEPGWDATISYGHLDFKFTNNYSVPIKIKAFYEDSKKSVTFQIYATEQIDVSNVKLYTKGKGKNWTLYREVDGVVNYKSSSRYK